MAGAYGSHYEMLQDFDMVVLAPQVNSYYDDIKEDTDRLGIKLVGCDKRSRIYRINERS